MVDNSSKLKTEIERLKHEKNAVILAHYYTLPEVQEVADFLGDSLALSIEAQKTDARIILFAGVHFMAETAKVLSPEKKVLLPNLEAGCSLAESCDAAAFAAFKAKYPGYKVVSYVNTSVGVKALTDVCCTSSNALKVVESIPADQPIIFAPDRNLGSYIQKLTGRENMVIWDLPCARGVFVGENPGTEAAASRSAGGGASRMQGLYRAGGRFRRFDGGYSGLLRQKFRQGVYRGDRSGDSDRDEAPLSGEDVYPGPSRRRGVRMQQLQVYEDDYAGEYLHHAARRAARNIA